MSNLPIFITGNQNKADYLSQFLGVPLKHQKVELDESQSMELNEIVTHKVKQAYDIIHQPVLVEDIALGFTALNGLPGPFIKFFEDAPNGCEKLCRMLDGFDDRSAATSCMYGYYDGATLKLFHATMDGIISNHPRGENGFGWDSIFEPAGYDGKTRAELSPEDYHEVYEIIRPYTALREYFKS